MCIAQLPLLFYTNCFRIVLPLPARAAEILKASEIATEEGSLLVAVASTASSPASS